MNRSLICAIVLGSFLLGGHPAASGEIKAAQGYTVQVVSKAGMAFAGLALDGESQIVTELHSGRLYRVAKGGIFTPFGPTLPHGRDVIGDPTGPYQIVRHGSTFLVSQGWTPNGSEAGPFDHALLEVDNDKVVRVVSSDFLNPYHFSIEGETAYVVDAAQNSVERIALNGTAKKTLVNFARLSKPQTAMKQLSPTEFEGGGPYAFDAVPTGIAPHEKRLYVSLFGGFPFLPGSGQVVSLAMSEDSQDLRIEEQDLNSPVDVGFDETGHMVVLEHGTYEEGTGFVPGSGRLIRFDLSKGSRDVILEGLTRPVSLLSLDATTIAITCLDGKIIQLKRTAD